MAEVSKVTINFSVHTIIEAAQRHHGLRYRQYCSNKLRRLRSNTPQLKNRDLSCHYKHKRASAYKANPFTHPEPHPKNENTTTTDNNEGENNEDVIVKQQEEDDTMDVEVLEKLLLTLLFCTERCWSFAQELKQSDNLNDKRLSTEGQIRSHMLSKCRKMIKYACQLENTAKKYESMLTHESLIEVSAYASWMRGNLALEVENWKVAVMEYTQSYHSCRSLLKLNNEYDIVRERIDHVIMPVLTFCQYEWKSISGEEMQTAETTSSGGALTATAGIPLKDNNGNMNLIEFRGKNVKVTNSALRVQLVKVNDLRSELDQLFTKVNGSNNSKTNSKKLDSVYVSLLSAYDDAIKLVEEDVKAIEGSMMSSITEARKSEQLCLLGYVKFGKLSCTLQRNESMVNAVKGALLNNKNKQQEYYHAKRVEEIAHLYDLMLQSAKEVELLPGDDKANDDDDFAVEARARVLRIRSYRCYYMAQIYINRKKFAEARALLGRAVELVAEAIDELGACDLNDLANEMTELEKEVIGSKCRVEATAYLSSLSNNTTDKKGSDRQRTLLERINDFDDGGSAGQHLVNVPPIYEVIPTHKPVLIDAAFNSITHDMPDLMPLIDAHKPRGSLLGWLRG